MEHKQLTEYFKTCTHADQERILSGLLAIMGQRLDPDLNSIQNDLLKEQGITCPHCQSAKIVANGKRNSVQRYWCRACNKHFRETTGTPLAWLKKKDKWLPYLRCMLSGYSLRKSAKETGISLQTSFDWRHKVLQAFKTISPEGFTGISESDDIFFLESEKGNRNLDRKARRRGGKASKAGISNEQVAVIASCDRSGHKDFQVVGKGRISKKDIDKALGAKLDDKVILCTDSHRSYTAFAKSKNLQHQKIVVSKGQYVKDQVYHVQHVNNMTSRLKQWLNHFNGVSTKYLQNYLNWFMVLEHLKDSTKKAGQFAFLALSYNRAWFEFKELAMNQALLRT